jgi:CRISPR/Cas system type I-B associated protein Csh2 (Cas7 group RAMP superfamily)
MMEEKKRSKEEGKKRRGVPFSVFSFQGAINMLRPA